MNLGIVAYVFNSRSWEAEAGKSLWGKKINITSLVSYSSILCKLNVTHDDELELCIWLLFLKLKFIVIFIYLFTYFMCVCSRHCIQIAVRWQTVSWFSVCHVSSRNPAQVVRCDSKCLYSLNHLTSPVCRLLTDGGS